MVTGGLGLLGQIFVSEASKLGAHVVVADIAGDNPVDTTSPDAIKQFVDGLDCIDGWVNNAYPRTKDWGTVFEKISPESWRANVDMHLNGYVFCMQAVLEKMKKQKSGSLVNIASIYGMVGPQFGIYDGTPMTMPAAYAAIKAGILNMTRYLASYYGKSGVRVNAVSPGGIFDNQNPAFVEKYNHVVPMGRMGKPDEIAGGVMYLLSDASAYVTGQNLAIDGGWTAI